MKDSESSSQKKHAINTRRGFALPAVLTVTGVVTLIFLVAITALSSLTAEAASARARVRFLQDALTAEANLTLLAVTEPIRSSAIAIGAPRIVDLFSGAEGNASNLEQGFIQLDGRPYAFDLSGKMIIQVQDQAGLINLASLSEEQHTRLMQAVGVEDAEIPRLRARYLDYVDPDNLRRVDGAEQRDYSDTSPANRPLKTPNEWLSVLGARNSVDASKWRKLSPHLAADHTLLNANLNTSTKEAMEILFGIDENQSEAAINARSKLMFNSFSDFAAATGARYIPDDEISYVFPSGRMIFTIKDTRSAWTYRGRVILTPGGLEQPFWIDQTELKEAPRRAAADTSDATQFPYTPR